jgi:hypothetical protein
MELKLPPDLVGSVQAGCVLHSFDTQTYRATTEVKKMKVRKMISTILLGTGVIVAFLMVTVASAVGQTRTRPPAPPIATAQITFDFWIDDTHLPAGEYALYAVRRLDTLVLLRNTKTGAQEQTFLVPTGDPVASGDYKLVFVVHTGKHYLQEVWESAGKAVLTSQFGVNVGAADTRSEIPLVARSAAKTVAAPQ